MSDAKFKIRVRKLKAKADSFIENEDADPQALIPIIDEIKILLEQATSAVDVNILVETLECTSSYIKNSNLNEKVWKKDMYTLSQGFLEGINGNGDDFRNLQNFPVAGIFPRVPFADFCFNGVRTYGFQTNVKEEKTENKNKELKKLTNKAQQILTRPEKVLSQTGSENSLATQIEICIEKLYETYNNYKNTDIPYFNFVMNIISFVHTVYNIFITSFLVKEHHAILSVDKHEQLSIRPAMPYQVYKSRKDDDSAKGYIDDDIISSQLLISINMNDWMLLKKALKIKSSVLPILCPTMEEFVVIE